MIKIEHILPFIMIIESVAASVLYAATGNWKMCIYWLAAAVMTTSIVM